MQKSSKGFTVWIYRVGTDRKERYTHMNDKTHGFSESDLLPQPALKHLIVTNDGVL